MSITDNTLKKNRPVSEQISEKLDGRSQRWLANKIGMDEPLLSNKMNGKSRFTVPEVELIASILDCTFEIAANYEAGE